IEDCRKLTMLNNEFFCSICMSYFIDPVTIGCVQSFCGPCLCIRWEEAPNPPCCPVCTESSYQMSFKTNIVLKTQVFLARRARLSYLPSSAQQMCGIHMKTKNFFCEVVKDILCLLCCKSKEHKAHRHCSIDWTAEEYRKHWFIAKSYKRRKQELASDKETSKIRTWEGYVNLRRKMIYAEYRKVHLLLYEEEQKYLERLEKESKEIFQQLQESENTMALKGKILRGMYEELKEMCHKPDMELLQYVFLVISRSELVQLLVLQLVNPEISSWPITGLINRLTRFQAVYISLDHEIVTCHVPVFEDLRRVLFSGDHLDVDHNSTRSKSFLAWGAQTFISGKYYWEVDVGHCWHWVIGLCNDSWTMRHDMLLSSEGIFLLFCVKENNQYSLFTSSPLLPQYVERPLGHVGVFLDYELGVVSFVHVNNGTLICSLLSCSFSSPLRPFLCCG
uniref:Tripartite motif containing 77 n=1 Tax=Loxodonta africana TaxID=9785 RepID=G3U4V7_LOXAF